MLLLLSGCSLLVARRGVDCRPHVARPTSLVPCPTSQPCARPMSLVPSPTSQPCARFTSLVPCPTSQPCARPTSLVPCPTSQPCARPTSLVPCSTSQPCGSITYPHGEYSVKKLAICLEIAVCFSQPGTVRDCVSGHCHDGTPPLWNKAVPPTPRGDEQMLAFPRA